MVRPLLPKEEDRDYPDRNSGASPEPKSAKRRCVSSACLPCRRRKSKCDGSLPACSTCVAVYQTPCSYDVESDQRRKVLSKKETDPPKAYGDACDVLITMLRTAHSNELSDLVEAIRSADDVEILAESLKSQETFFGRRPSQSLDEQLADYLGSLSVLDEPGKTRYYGHTAGLGLSKLPSNSSPPKKESGAWTTVTHDAKLVEHLMALYFCWDYPCHPVFCKELFLDDMARGRRTYCSSILVNTVLALGCGLSDLKGARADPYDPSTVGDHFFAEARRLLNEDDSSCITTVQALMLMGVREASCGRESAGFQLTGRAMRMALELGLHSSRPPNPELSESTLSIRDIEARMITFWGCFTLDTAWSIMTGRLPQLPRAAIKVWKPVASGELAIEKEIWRHTVDPGQPRNPGLDQHAHILPYLQYSSTLAELVNDTVFAFYASTEKFDSKKLLRLYSNYKGWKSSLPLELELTDKPTPQLLCLHMFYHTVVLHLFRPFLKMELVDSDVNPQIICKSSAEKISILLHQYRSIYGLRRINLILPHVVQTSCTMHLLDLPQEPASKNIIRGLHDMQDMSINHPLSTHFASHLRGLAQRLRIGLPQEVVDLAEMPDSLMAGYSDSADNNSSISSPAQAAIRPIMQEGQYPTYTNPFPSRSLGSGSLDDDLIAIMTNSTSLSPPVSMSIPTTVSMSFHHNGFQVHAMPSMTDGANGTLNYVSGNDSSNYRMIGCEQLNQQGFRVIDANNPAHNPDTFHGCGGYQGYGQWTTQ